MPNINNPSTQWENLYALAGIAPGTAVNVQNQSGQTLYIRQNTTDQVGRAVRSYENQDCYDTAVLQARSAGGLNLFVQEI